MQEQKMTKRFGVRGITLLAAIAFVFAAILVALPAQKAYAASIPELASEQYSRLVPFPVKVTLDQNNTRTKAMDLIKQFREEALNEGIVTLPAGMTRSQYINGIKWDSQIEAIAVQRAIEGAARFAHTRPSGQDCFTAQTATAVSTTEILASASNITNGMWLFYREKEDYVKQLHGENLDAVTGHYQALISPGNVAYGFSAVSVKGTISGAGACVAGEAAATGQDSASLGYSGEYDATIRLQGYSVAHSLEFKNNPVALNSTTRAIFQLKYTTMGSFDLKVTLVSAVPADLVRFSSSDPSVATIDSSGTVRGIKEGQTRITASYTVSYIPFVDTATLDVANSQVMYRLYNPNSGEHFYTADAGEYESVGAAGWDQEGVAWTAPVTSKTPVYRLYSGTDHHYTPDAAERDMLVRAGWSYEGIGWYSDDAKGVGLHRLFNPHVDPSAATNNSGSHHYTTNDAERDNLVSLGWQYENIGWYGCK